MSPRLFFAKAAFMVIVGFGLCASTVPALGARGGGGSRGGGFVRAVKLTPNDKLASHYSQQLQSNSPLTPPQMATKPGSDAR